jgi:hypothetical protein
MTTLSVSAESAITRDDLVMSGRPIHLHLEYLWAGIAQALAAQVPNAARHNTTVMGAITDSQDDR